MNLKYLKVDMDYCSSPLWGSTSRQGFANLDESYYIDSINRSTVSILEWYRYMWEWQQIQNDQALCCYLGSIIIDIKIKAAKLLKQELPDHFIFYSFYKENGRKVLIEVL